jgi:hypothetical protein
MTDDDSGLTTSVVALAGRRTDLAGAQPPRFPLDQVPEVSRRIAGVLKSVGAVALVCSGACGADLAALEEAERLGVRRRIVLPFAPARFRVTSVIDRPGGWGPKFDRQIAATIAAGDLVILNGDPDNDIAYAAANEVIVRQATELARPGHDQSGHRLISILVWEGTPRAEHDATADFGRLARNAGFKEHTILTS